MKQRHRTLRRVFSVALTLVTVLAVAAPVSSAASEPAAPAQAEIQEQTTVNMEEFPDADEMSRVLKGFHLGFEGQLALFKESDKDILLVFGEYPEGYYYGDFDRYYVSMMPDHPEKGEAISTPVCLDDVFAKLGISTGTRYEITEVNEIDGTFYLSYKSFEKSKQQGHADAEIVSGAGIISTSDGVNFSPVNLGSNTFPDTDPVTGEGTVSPYSIHKVKDTFVVTPGAPLNSSPNIATAYYTSADTTNWVKRSSRDFTDVKSSATGEFNLQFEVATVTENGIFFRAYNWNNGEQTVTEEWGVFYTEDFVHYTLASPDPKTNNYHTYFDTDTVNGVLPGGKIAVISQDFTSGGEKKPVVVSFFDEETKEVKTLFTTDVEQGADEYYVAYRSLDPVILDLRESLLDDEGEGEKTFTVYEVSSKDGVNVKKTVIDGSAMNFGMGLWGAGVTFKDVAVGDKRYSFTFEAGLYGAIESKAYFHIFDGDFQRAYQIDFMPTVDEYRNENFSFSRIHHIELYRDDGGSAYIVILTDCGYISYSVADLVAPLNPLTVLKDEASDVSVEPSVPGALPEDTKLNVEVLDTDDAAVDKYDIKLTKGEAEIQPTYPVFVTLPIPADKANMSYKVYREEDDGRRTEMIAETVDGKIRFATDHFSVYTVEWTAAEPGPGDSGNQNGGAQGGENSGSSGGTQGSTGGSASGATGSSGSTSGSSQASSGTESGKQSPKTGETSFARLYVIISCSAVCAVSLAAAVVVGGRRRTRRKSNRN